MHTSKTYRLREFVRPTDGRSLVVDASAGLSLGPLPGLERFEAAVRPVLPLVDGVVVSPGQARRLADRTRADAALLARATWTNALRGDDFVLPPAEINLIPLLSPADALDLGVSALVLDFLLGYEEHVEAACLRATVQLALEGSQAGIPLLVDVRPTGPRVVLYSKAVELGVSYALEGGADGVAVPWPGTDSFSTILKMAGETPVWVKAAPGDAVQAALDAGAAGLWLGAEVFARPDPAGALSALGEQLHAPAGAQA